MTNREVSIYDSSDMFQVLADFNEQIDEAYNIGQSFNPPGDFRDVNKIIISGLGGSAIGGDLLRSVLWYELKIPIYVNRNYKIPSFADKSTLTIISSYSGNTEESLSAYNEAKDYNCKIICLSSGGNLSLLAENDGNLLIKIPKGYQPRCALGYSFIPLLILMFKLGFISNKSRDILRIRDSIKNRSKLYTNFDDSQNYALKIAKLLKGKLPVIYSSSDLLDVVNLRWRCQISENSKTLAFGNLLPEMNHNEIVGWQENPALLKNLAVISLIDKEDHVRIQKRNEITIKLISDLAALAIELDGEGESKLERIFDLIYLGDWVSFYLAILNKIDPTPVEKINFLKNKLMEN
ncbi:MAG: bifunctional phosphoglucose/phosphomannose isomerase [Ignavibacteria bacterium]